MSLVDLGSVISAASSSITSEVNRRLGMVKSFQSFLGADSCYYSDQAKMVCFKQWWIYWPKTNDGWYVEIQKHTQHSFYFPECCCRVSQTVWAMYCHLQ